MPYSAIQNTPGYLPMSDDPPVFLTCREAWQYHVEEIDRLWDYSIDEDGALLDVHTQLHVQDQSEPGTLYGTTPGYDGEHDLGIAYSVIKLEGVWYDSPYDGITDAETALEAWINAEELALDDADTECLYQFTARAESAEFNIAAIAQGAAYMGLDLDARGYSLPTKIED